MVLFLPIIFILALWGIVEILFRRLDDLAHYLAAKHETDEERAEYAAIRKARKDRGLTVTRFLAAFDNSRQGGCRCCIYWNDINADPYNEYGGLLDGGDYDINSGRRCTCGHARCRGYQAGLYR